MVIQFSETMIDFLVGAARNFSVPIPADWRQQIHNANAAAVLRKNGVGGEV